MVKAALFPQKRILGGAWGTEATMRSTRRWDTHDEKREVNAHVYSFYNNRRRLKGAIVCHQTLGAQLARRPHKLESMSNRLVRLRS
jgi:hypothetical protein